MREFIVRYLSAFKELNFRPMNIGIMNKGGTFTSVPILKGKSKGQLSPIDDQKDLEKILKISELEEYRQAGLINYQIIVHDPIDSSKQLDKHREPMISPLQSNYDLYDSFFILIGTDTAAESSRFLHFAFPYHDIFSEQKSINADKPIILISSQEPLIVKKNRSFELFPGSDGPVNLTTAIAAAALNRLGETGVLTNSYQIIGSSTVKKITGHGIPQFAIDKEIQEIGKRTSMGVTLNDSTYLPRVLYNTNKIPRTIEGSGNFEDSVLSITEHGHFSSIKTYLEAKHSAGSETVEFLKQRLPKVIIYGSKGQGNVQGPEEIGMLLEMLKEGVYIVKVPVPGGRLTDKMIYDVSGAEITALNIEQTTARYKSQAVLAVLTQQQLSSEKRQSEFYRLLCHTKFGNEFLPNN